jgi:hypothetical protein
MFIYELFSTYVFRFLLPALQIQYVLDQPTAGDMEYALMKMPLGLNETFRAALTRIKEQSNARAQLGINTLMWISHARRLILVKELSEALAIRESDLSLNRKFCPLPKKILDCCRGLVIIDEESMSIRLVHYSAHEYLREVRDEIFPDGEGNIVKLCLTYLLYNTFADGCYESEYEIEDRLKNNPFLRYAACYWGHHARDAKSERGREFVLRLLQSRSNRNCSSQIHQFVYGLREEYWEPEEIKSFNALHVTSFFNLCGESQQILDSGEVDVNAATNIGTTPLNRAASWGHVELAKLLMAYGADPRKENWYGSVLHCVAEAGESRMMEEFLKNEIDVDARGLFGRTALHYATECGHTTIVRQLLGKGADVNAVDDNEQTPLHLAAHRRGPVSLFRALIDDAGADWDATDDLNNTPFFVAINFNNVELVDLLLSEGMDLDVNGTNCKEQTPLHLASERSNAKMVKVLPREGSED